METQNPVRATSETLRIMVVGNNPLELSKLLTRIQKINDKKVVIETAFDMQSILSRLGKFSPDFILLDDNLGRAELRQVVKSLYRAKETRDIPITVLKNSNYTEAIGSGVMDYLLKETLTGESLYRALVNSLKFRKTQQYLYMAYKKRKGQLLRLFKSEPALQI
jgi:CheY-like chemotaxis protein